MDGHSLTREQEQLCLLSLSGVIPYRTLLQCLLDWMTIFCSWTPPLLSCVMILVSILSLALDLFTDHRFPPPSASSVVANRMTFLTRALYNEPDRQSSRTRVCIWSIIVLIYWWFIFHIQIYVFFTSLCHLENLDLGVCN